MQHLQASRCGGDANQHPCHIASRSVAHKILVSAARGRHVAHCVQEVHGGLLARSQGLLLGGPESVARVPVALREAAWVEAADCFTAMLPGQEVRLSAVQ